MPTKTDSPLIDSLLRHEAYPHSVSGEVELIETHISWVLLAGEFVYKIKKPIKNPFLDYSQLALRKRCCEEELRLNKRFAGAVYLDVAAIVSEAGALRFSEVGVPVEYAVRMKRFPPNSLLLDQLLAGQIGLWDVQQLAKRIACFHANAAKADTTSRFGAVDLICAEAIDNCTGLLDVTDGQTLELVDAIQKWTHAHFAAHRKAFCDRKNFGHVRECHGDLHLGNIVQLYGVLLPFDGIEFSDDFRWIDTLSDAAFTAMDFAANGRFDFCHSFINAYFEASGDYAAIQVLQWYLVYRAMVRAKVAALRAQQFASNTPERAEALQELEAHLVLAQRFAFSRPCQPRLWITYGVSGSGKTCGSEQLLQRHAAMRVRADVERKRLAGLCPTEHLQSNDPRSAEVYAPEMTQATYHRLAELADALLVAGESVIVDATCLKRWQRNLFRSLAEQRNVEFRILAFHAEHSVLRQRIADRIARGSDASDADLEVLEKQIAHQEHLEADEMQFVGSVDD